MINKYDEAIKNIMSKNRGLSAVDYIGNHFVLNDLNQMNKIMSPAITSMSESQQKSIEDLQKLLGEIEQIFPCIEKYKSIHKKLETEQVKLKGELFVIKLETLKK